MGSVFRATWPAFAMTLVITVITGWLLMTYCPQANKITELFGIVYKSLVQPVAVGDGEDHAAPKRNVRNQNKASRRRLLI